MPRNTGGRRYPQRRASPQRPPTPEGFRRVDEVAALLRVTDEQVTLWIRGGKLAAEKRSGKWLIPQAEVDRILLGEAGRPLDRTPALAGERGSASLPALAIGALAAGGIAPGLHDHRHVLLIVAALAAFVVLNAALWVLADYYLDRPVDLDRPAGWLVGPETDAPLHDDHGEAWL